LKGIQVIYEDEHILLLDKPAGILSQKAKPEDMSLNEWMIGYLLHSKVITDESLRHFKPSVCNRLDRNTSGLVICGKTLLGSREMSRMLKDRSLQKYYHTYVHGKLDGEKVLEGYHYKDKNVNQAKILFDKPTKNIEQYDSIITSYRSLEVKKEYSYLEIELITGKTHQIRAHLAAYGHPLVGDKKYGNQRAANHKNYPKYQLLHAYRVVFPTLDGELKHLSNKEFICEEPKAFKQFEKNIFNG
jgi:23S rRNA pseudouridine955/2504/2580 synthase